MKTAIQGKVAATDETAEAKPQAEEKREEK